MRRLVLVAVLAACSGQRAQRASSETVRTAKLERRDVVDRVLLTGELKAASAIDLAVPRTDTWQLSIRWLVEDGTAVKQGDKLVEFDNSAFTKELEQKKLALRDAEMGLGSTAALGAIESSSKQTELDQAKIALQKATLKADVPADLLAGRDSQERQLDKKRAEIAVKKAEESLAAQKQQQALEMKVKQIELDKARRAIDAAEKTIGALVLTAPRDGVVVIEDHPWEGRKFHVGDTVQPGMTIVTLPDLDTPMQVQADLSDVDDGRAAVAMTGTCTLDAYPAEPIACTVRDLTPVARIEGQKSLRRAFAVTLTLASSKDKMRPGMSVKVELRRGAVPGLVVPRGAIVFDKPTRVRLADGSLREVTLGACDEQGCAVEKGLADSETVRL
jgi:multidrug efflux pump subunit AcrA (membrane-fusion protein)